MSKTMKRTLYLILALVMTLTAMSVTAFAEETDYTIGNGETLTIYTVLSGQAASKHNSYNEHPAILLEEEALGINLEFIHPPQDDDGTFFSSVVASGMWPDIWNADFSAYPGDVDGAIADGMIININEYVNEEYMPNYMAIYNGLSEAEKKNMVNDSGIHTKLGVSLDPVEILINEQHTGPIIRSDKLEELGIESPTTLDEFTATLYALKDAGFEIPLGLFKFTEWTWINSTFITGAFGVVGNTTKGFLVDEAGNATYAMRTDGWKEFVTYLNGLYNDGIIDRDFVNRTQADTKKLMYNGTVACMSVGNWETREIIQLGQTVDPNFMIQGIHLPRKDADAPYNVGYRREQGTDSNDGFQISTTCKYPEIAARWIDFQYSEYGLELMNYGPETVEVDGETKTIWTKGENGEYIFSDYIVNNPDVAFNTIRSWYSIDNMQAIYHVDYQKMQYDAPICWQCWEAWGYNVSNIGVIPQGLTLTAEESNEVVKAMSTISAFVDEMTYKFILGEESIDNWDAYVQQIIDLGIEDIEAIYTGATARYNAR